MEDRVKNNLTMAARPSIFQHRVREDLSRRLPETTRHMSSRAETNREDREEETRTASCSTASLPRVKESLWQLQTGAK